MRQTLLNRLSDLEDRLQPLAPEAAQPPIEVWRVSKTTPRLYRLESGGPWIDEDEYQAQIGPAAPPAPGKRKNAPRLVEVLGDWREFKDIDRT